MSKFSNITLVVSLIYIIVVTIFLFWHRVGFSPDQFFALALLITLLLGRVKQFIHDWSIPVMLFLSYDYLRGLLPKLSLKAHIFPMIDFDKAFFGGIPSIQLQALFYSSGKVHWYDFVAVVLYMSHFVVPMVLGFLFWLKNKKYFTQYTLALLLLSYGAFITFVIFPAMPPWMASQQGFIPSVTKVMDQVFASFPTPINLPSVYQFVGVNLVAAVPSLHAAYPWLTLLFLVKKFKIKGILILPYVLGVWFSIVYLGEHYVFDILIGVLYASLIFYFIINGIKIQRKISMILSHIRVQYE